MKNVKYQSALLALAATLAWPLGLIASGSYISRLPQPPAQGAKGAKVDKAKYDLGQKVFNGKTAPGEGNATAQRTRLEALERQLPSSVAAKKDLSALAGKLTDEQLDALEYFVKERYPSK